MSSWKARARFARASWIVVLASACGSGTAEPSEDVRQSTQHLDSSVQAAFEQILRVNPGETNVRNRCELTIPLLAPTPLTFIAQTGTEAESIGWKGSAITGSKLQISACAAYPCEVTALWRAGVESGEPVGCEMVADDGVARFVGTSTGTALTVAAAPTAPVIFNQAVKLGTPGSSVTGRCTFRQNSVLPDAEVTGFKVFLNAVQVLDVSEAMPIGTVPFATRWSLVAFGTIYLGFVDSPSATLLKHVTPRSEQLTEGDALRCAGAYHASAGTSVFDVNLSASPVGDGMSLLSAASGWTCGPAQFGTGDACDCGCGIEDPDCDPIDVNECADPARCGRTVNWANTCTNQAPGYDCSCGIGFALTSDETPDETCTDIDECAVAPSRCGRHLSASNACTNTVGSYSCSCASGFSRTGAGTTSETCIDTDECASSTTCNAYLGFGSCMNTVGSYTCSCSAGYGFDGVTCTPESDCTTGNNTCVSNAYCTATGGYTCACDPGFTGDGYGEGTGCTDIDECASSSTCGQDLSNLNGCTNIAGRYLCSCGTGFQLTGAGLAATCVDRDECAAVAPCGVGSCSNTSGSYACVCPTGYTAPATGGTCVKVEC